MSLQPSKRGQSILIIGIHSEASVGAYLCRAARSRRLQVHFRCSEEAYPASRILRSMSLRLFGGLPFHGRRFNAAIRSVLAVERPAYLLTTGTSPVSRDTLLEARRLGVKSLNYSTDDPWNARHAARWFFSAVKEYDVVATPRSATISDFHSLGVRRVVHTPFGYCPESHRPDCAAVENPSAGDVFFAGGCDEDRLPFFQAIVRAGLRPILYGGYWNRYREMRRFHRGFASLTAMATLHAQTPVSVCLVRRSNRDEHVMRTFEAAAMGACLAMEDTPAHRRLFGDDGEYVIYFSDPDSLVDACERLLADATLRQRLRGAARQVVVGGGNTYTDRLDQMLAVASEP